MERPPKIETTLNIVKDLKAERVPIHGIGFQGHLGIQYDYPGDWANVMQRFADLGLEVAVTELDVRMVLPVTPEKLATQADYYRRALTDCLSVRACRELTVWGFTDLHSWVPGWFDGEGAATLMDENYAPKTRIQSPAVSEGPQVAPTTAPLLSLRTRGKALLSVKGRK
ncbi:endo-1,4-beta-xylanase [Nonomuraea salmonea]|uniref:endo-1,4-beta-xylanase n=1 Tax=Nonomuraea salmonea TaxID=46181 RepID=UPI002FED43CB